MSIRELHFSLDLALDRIASLSNPDLNVAEKDWLLNEAQLMFIKQRFSPLSNQKRVGFENTEKRIEDLSTLVVKYPQQAAITPTITLGVAEVDLSLTAFPFMFLVSAWCDILVEEDCTKQVQLKFVQHDDYRDVLRDPFNGPSLEYIPYNLGLSLNSNSVPSIYIYPGIYDVTAVYPEYIRRPKKVSLGTYASFDGVVHPEQTLELPEHVHLEVVDLAAQIASLAIENPEYVALRSQKVLINE